MMSVKGLNHKLQMACQGMEEITVGIGHSEEAVLTSDDIEYIKLHANKVLEIIMMHRNEIEIS